MEGDEVYQEGVRAPAHVFVSGASVVPVRFRHVPPGRVHGYRAVRWGVHHHVLGGVPEAETDVAQHPFHPGRPQEVRERLVEPARAQGREQPTEQGRERLVVLGQEVGHEGDALHLLDDRGIRPHLARLPVDERRQLPGQAGPLREAPAQEGRRALAREGVARAGPLPQAVEAPVDLVRPFEREGPRQDRGLGPVRHGQHGVRYQRQEARERARAQPPREHTLHPQQPDVASGPPEQAVADAAEDADGGVVGERVGEVEPAPCVGGERPLEDQAGHDRPVLAVEREVGQQACPQAAPVAGHGAGTHAAGAYGRFRTGSPGLHQERAGGAQGVADVEPAVLVPRVAAHVEVGRPERDQLLLDVGGVRLTNGIARGWQGGASRTACR